MTKKTLGLSVVGLACALSLARAETPDFGAINMTDVQAAAAHMPTPYGAPRRRRQDDYSPYRAETVNVTLGNYFRFAPLPNCGGAVTFDIVRGRPEVRFIGVQQCSNFDILQSNLEPVRYPNQKLYGRNGYRDGTFAIPQIFMDWGYNTIVVSMKSDSGKHRDLIAVHFIAD